MRKVALIVVVLLLAITVVPAFAGHVPDHEPVSDGPLHCALEAPHGEGLQGAPEDGQGAGDIAGGDPANPSAPQAGEGSQMGDRKSDQNGKVCEPVREDEEGPPRDDPQPDHPE